MNLNLCLIVGNVKLPRHAVGKKDASRSWQTALVRSLLFLGLRQPTEWAQVQV